MKENVKVNHIRTTWEEKNVDAIIASSIFFGLVALLPAGFFAGWVFLRSGNAFGAVVAGVPVWAVVFTIFMFEFFTNHDFVYEKHEKIEHEIIGTKKRRI